MAKEKTATQMKTTKKKSLIKIAEEAKFYTIHGVGSQSVGLVGCATSDIFNIIYFNLFPEEKIEIFGIVDPLDYKTCALYILDIGEVRKRMKGNFVREYNKGGIFLDNQKPLYKGERAANVLEAYAKTENE